MAWTNKRWVIVGTVLLASPLGAQPASPGQATPAAAPHPAPVVAPQSAPAATTPLSGVNLGEFDTTKPGQLKWENNPFVQTIESVGVQDIHLTAIVYRPGNAAALINGRILREGDRIGDNQVVHIEGKRVVMRNADGIFSVTMSGVVK